MQFTILDNIQCGSKSSKNFRGEFTSEDMEEFYKTLICLSDWSNNVQKANLPLIAMTTFSDRIGKDYANPTSSFAFDFDDKENKIETAIDVFSPYSYFLYTTHSHTEDHNKFRIMVNLDMTIHNNEESHIVFKILKNRLSEKGLILDEACKDISRRFFLPSRDKNNNLPYMQFNEGKLLDVRDEFEKQKQTDKLEDDRRKLDAFYSKFCSKNKKTNHLNVPYFNSIEDQNIISKQKIENYLSLSKGNHYSMFFGLCSHMRKRASHLEYTITEDLMFKALRAIDNSDGRWYDDKYIMKKIQESR